MAILAKIFNLIIRVINKVLYYDFKRKCAECGEGLICNPLNSIFAGMNNFHIGKNVYIGPQAVLYSTDAKLKIGNKVVFGPHVTIATGDHRIDVIGKYIADNIDKLPENDADVVIEDDVWCGANVTILKGVTIGRGSVVAANSVVTRSLPGYCIGGVFLLKC